MRRIAEPESQVDELLKGLHTEPGNLKQNKLVSGEAAVLVAASQACL